MKSRTSLMLMELAVLLLVFALACALCLRAFAWADSRTRQNAAQDQALTLAQNAAVLVAHHHGDLDRAIRALGGREDTVFYDKHGVPASQGPYILRIVPQVTSSPYLGKAQVVVWDGSGQVLTQLTVCWQKEALS